jgi:hypothetical protein
MKSKVPISGPISARRPPLPGEPFGGRSGKAITLASLDAICVHHLPPPPGRTGAPAALADARDDARAHQQPYRREGRKIQQERTVPLAPRPDVAAHGHVPLVAWPEAVQ